MAYGKQTWYDGESGGTPITAARLNHIEDGISGVSDSVSQMSRIWQGSMVINGNGGYDLRLWTVAQFDAAFPGHAENPTVLVSNGDSASNEVHFGAVSYNASSGWWVHCDIIEQTSNAIRINYAIIA